MNCPVCNSNNWKALYGDRPISEDVISCITCCYDLNASERITLEQEMVMERMKGGLY